MSFGGFIRTQLITKIPQPTASFSSKTVIVTGGNAGLGLEAVKHIIALGASKVILGCRSLSKGKAVKLALESSLKCDTEILEVWQIDLASYASVQAFAARAMKLARLDVLINNAGILLDKFEIAGGTEQHITVHVISPVLLSLLVLPKLRQTAQEYSITPHLTFVSSALYSTAKFPKHHEDIFAWLSNKSNVNMMNQ